MDNPETLATLGTQDTGTCKGTKEYDKLLMNRLMFKLEMCVACNNIGENAHCFPFD